MAKKIVRGITDVKTINKQDFDTNNVNDLLSDGQYNYIHRKKGKTEEYHNLTDNIKTLSSDNTDLLSVTNNNKTTNTATLHPKHDSQKEQVLESTRNTVTINHGANGTAEKTTVDTNPQKVLEHSNLVSASEYITIEHEQQSEISKIKTDKLKNDMNALNNKIAYIGGRNLLSNTNQGKTNWEWPDSAGSAGGATVEDYDVDGINGVKLTRTSDDSASWSFIQYKGLLRNLIKPNTKYILSFDVKPSVDVTFSAVLKRGDGTAPLTNNAVMNKATANQWTSVSCVLTSVATLPEETGQVVYLQGMPIPNGNWLIIKNIKLEKGEVPSDWSPAPEDIDALLAQKQNKLIAGTGITIDGQTIDTNPQKVLEHENLKTGDGLSTSFNTDETTIMFKATKKPTETNLNTLPEGVIRGNGFSIDQVPDGNQAHSAAYVTINTSDSIKVQFYIRESGLEPSKITLYYRFIINGDVTEWQEMACDKDVIDAAINANTEKINQLTSRLTALEEKVAQLQGGGGELPPIIE